MKKGLLILGQTLEILIVVYDGHSMNKPANYSQANHNNTISIDPTKLVKTRFTYSVYSLLHTPWEHIFEQIKFNEDFGSLN